MLERFKTIIKTLKEQHEQFPEFAGNVLDRAFGAYLMIEDKAEQEQAQKIIEELKKEVM